MLLSAEEVYQKKCNGFQENRSMAVATNFDCSWNSRGWQAKEGVVAAITQDNGKIVDVIHKVSFCRECRKKQDERDKHDITSIEYMEWYIQHEPDCQLNHTGNR